jgi:hypothetical protein
MSSLTQWFLTESNRANPEDAASDKAVLDRSVISMLRDARLLAAEHWPTLEPGSAQRIEQVFSKIQNFGREDGGHAELSREAIEEIVQALEAAITPRKGAPQRDITDLFSDPSCIRLLRSASSTARFAQMQMQARDASATVEPDDSGIKLLANLSIVRPETPQVCLAAVEPASRDADGDSDVECDSGRFERGG